MTAARFRPGGTREEWAEGSPGDRALPAPYAGTPGSSPGPSTPSPAVLNPAGLGHIPNPKGIMTREKQKVLERVVEGALIFLVLAVLALVSMGVYSIYDVVFD